MTRAELDPNLKQAAAIGTPVEVFDPSTNERYYLLSAEQFQQLASKLCGDFDPRDVYPVIDAVMANDDLDDPLLESYQ
jgi:hypothetical protein